MSNREKVIGLLQETAEYFRECRSNASFASKAENHFWELQNAANEAVELLKEQEPVRAVADGEDSYRCNNCGTVIGWAEWEPGGIEEVKYKFCPECGRKVKWDDI